MALLSIALTCSSTVIALELEPYLVKNLNTQVITDNFSDSTTFFEDFVSLDNELLFSANNGTVLGHELWRTDGTEDGTQLVRDIFEGSADSLPQEFVNIDGTVYFSARSELGRELWKSDGSFDGTVLARIIHKRRRTSFNPLI